SQTVLPHVAGQSDVPRSERTHESSALCHHTKPSGPASCPTTLSVSPSLRNPTREKVVPGPERNNTTGKVTVKVQLSVPLIWAAPPVVAAPVVSVTPVQ